MSVNMKTYLMIGIILFAVAIIFLAVSQITYQPKVDAFSNATGVWLKHPSNEATPSPEQFGLTTESIMINGILMYIAVALIFVGIVIIACFVIVFIADRRKDILTNKETKQPPSD